MRFPNCASLDFIVARDLLFWQKESLRGAYDARRGGQGALLGKVIPCAARRSTLPFRWRGASFPSFWLAGRRVFVFQLPPPPFLPSPRNVSKFDRRKGKAPPLLPLLTVGVRRGIWPRRKKRQETGRRLFFFRLRSLRPQEAKLVQSIDVMPSLAFDEPGRISQHLTFPLYP